MLSGRECDSFRNDQLFWIRFLFTQRNAFFLSMKKVKLNGISVLYRQITNYLCFKHFQNIEYNYSYAVSLRNSMNKILLRSNSVFYLINKYWEYYKKEIHWYVWMWFNSTTYGYVNLSFKTHFFKYSHKRATKISICPICTKCNIIYSFYSNLPYFIYIISKRMPLQLDIKLYTIVCTPYNASTHLLHRTSVSGHVNVLFILRFKFYYVSIRLFVLFSI